MRLPNVYRAKFLKFIQAKPTLIAIPVIDRQFKQADLVIFDNMLYTILRQLKSCLIRTCLYELFLSLLYERLFISKIDCRSTLFRTIQFV